MAKYTKETVVSHTKQADLVARFPVGINATNSQTLEYLIYFAFGAAEILLTFRLLLKFMGAGSQGAFVGMIYGISNIFILPFEGIFRRGFNEGIETTSVFEPSVLVAIIVYAVLAWGIVRLVRIFSGERQPVE
ncbi:YggT family protein [Candidatus Microgenomates bacterium]|nr:MAG: YggT family protein [Candidatus Microgenomates bacterium]